MDTAVKNDPVSVIGLRVHVLIDGGGYDLVTRRANPGVAVTARG